MNPNRISRVFPLLRFVFLGASILLGVTVLGGLVGSPWIGPAGYCWAAGYILTAIAAPEAALLIFAAIAPIIGMSTRFIGMALPPPASAELLIVALLLGYSVRRLWSQPVAFNGAEIAAVVVACLAAASAAAYLPVVYAYTTSTMSISQEGMMALVREYFVRRGEMRPIHDAAVLIESAALFVIGTRACRQQVFRLSLLRMLVVGATAAALLNIIILALGLLRGDANELTLTNSLRLLRINVHHNDFNAAGSYFVLFLSVAVGFARGRERRWAWPAATILVAAVWLAGSRSAMAALAISAIVAFLWMAAQTSHQSARKIAIASASVTLAIATLLIVLWPRAGANMAFGPAFSYRVHLWEAGVRMICQHPLLGVGVGQFPLFSQRLRPLLDGGVPQGPENAHNNLLQVGAELGVPALLGLVAWIAIAFVAAVRHVRTQTPYRLEVALLTGLAAFLLTCLVGHPLLTSVVAFPFWLGLAAASADGGTTQQGSRFGWVPVVFVAFVVASVPSRAQLFAREANLEHIGRGLSSWRDAPDGVKYREAQNCSGVFVPGDAAIVSIPVRLIDSNQLSVTISFSIDDRLFDAIRVESVDWRNFRVRLPPAAAPSRYRFLQFRVRGEGDNRCSARRLWVGKAFALDATGKRIL